MRIGLEAAVLWALETLLLAAGLSHGRLDRIDSFHASLTAAALHDAASAVYLLLYHARKKQLRAIPEACKTKGGRKIVLAALLGGPVGMTCYLLAIQMVGASVATSISALYPAIGALLSFVFLWERLRAYQIAGILLGVGGMVLMGLSGSTGSLRIAGFVFAVLCAVSWGSEAVISSVGMKQSGISSELALQIRQLTSALTYLVIISPAGNISRQLVPTIQSRSFLYLITAALAGTLSYFCYYKAIQKLGPSKAMALNITYTVWVILMGAFRSRIIPDGKSILCAVMISIGSILAAWERKHLTTVKE